MIMRWLVVAVLFCVADAASAKEIPFLYSKSQLAITRKSLQQDPNLLPWQKQQADALARIVFNIEVRDGRSLYNQKGWFNLSSYEERSGVLLAFTSPTLSPIVGSAQYAPVDILFIDRQGVVTEILPSIMLSELEQEIMPQSPVQAFLFLKSGTCEQLVIAPGDEVEFSLFKKPPTVLSTTRQEGELTPLPAQAVPIEEPAEPDLSHMPKRYLLKSKSDKPKSATPEASAEKLMDLYGAQPKPARRNTGNVIQQY